MATDRLEFIFRVVCILPFRMQWHSTERKITYKLNLKQPAKGEVGCYALYIKDMRLVNWHVNLRKEDKWDIEM